jgi:hypothetical protein
MKKLPGHSVRSGYFSGLWILILNNDNHVPERLFISPHKYGRQFILDWTTSAVYKFNDPGRPRLVFKLITRFLAPFLQN